MAKEMRATHLPGMYEYVVARTSYFDNIVQQALQNNTSQIVFLGAGYDTRAYRFKDLIDSKTKIFELDIHTTQEQKIKLLNQNNISIPEQLTFVPINFNKETLESVLAKYGYGNGQTNLFIWEGVSYYLSSKEVDDILSFIKKSSAINSTVCFDYATFWPEMMDAHGVKELIETMKKKYSGETTKFGIERGKMKSFLAERGFKIIDHMTAEEMERKYLMLRDGSLAGKVIGIFCFAHASVSG
jgi:methyltransferase (TIGR00027 family)